MSNTVSLVVLGGAGRMGRAVVAAATDGTGFVVKGMLVRTAPTDHRPLDPPAFTDLDEVLKACPGAVAVVFTTPPDAPALVRAVAERAHPLVVGTTGMGQAGDRAMAEAAERVAVVEAPNTSPGMALLRRALRTILAADGPEWNISVLDRDHRHKQDAPSGTALQLESVIAETGRDSDVVSVREGDVVGEHTVSMSVEDEELVILHRALDRRVFARGALLAAAFAARVDAGRYTMDDVVERGEP